MESFRELVLCHDRLRRLYERHMEAVLLLDLRRAGELLVHFQHEVRRHIDAEEAVILPVYGDRAGPVPGGTPELITAEHRKMTAMLTQALSDLDAMTPSPREALAYLDRAFTFKRLMEHHDKREENLLYPWMDRITTDGERQVLLRRFIAMNGPLLEPYTVCDPSVPPM